MLERTKLNELKEHIYDLKDRVDVAKLKRLGNSALLEAKKISKHKVRYKGYSANTVVLAGVAVGLVIGGVLLYRSRKNRGVKLYGSTEMGDQDYPIK